MHSHTNSHFLCRAFLMTIFRFPLCIHMHFQPSNTPLIIPRCHSHAFTFIFNNNHFKCHAFTCIYTTPKHPCRGHSLHFQHLHMPFQLSLRFSATSLNHCSHLHALFIKSSSCIQIFNKKTSLPWAFFAFPAHTHTFTCNSSFHMLP